jgi:hypothetical protein
MWSPPNEAGAGPGLYVCSMYARKHGIGVLVFATIIIGLLCAGPLLIGVPSRRFAIGYYGLAGLVYACFLAYAAANLVRGGVWRCVLTAEELEVHTPARMLGQSFRVRVEDIRRLEAVHHRGVDTGGTTSYFITDAQGSTFELTSNAAFEPQRVFDEILKLRPVKYVERDA